MRAATFFAILISCASDLVGQTAAIPTYRARVLGVFDDASGAALDSVRVTDVLTGNFSLTTRTGTVALHFLPDGGSLVRLQKIGYEVQTFPIAISPTDTTPITIIMRRVTELGPVRTNARANFYFSPRLREFDERSRAHNGGYFVGDSLLRAHDGELLADLLKSKMPNMNFAPGLASAMFLLKSPRCVAGGPPQVFIDGVASTPDLRPDAPHWHEYNGPKQTVFGQPIPGTEHSGNIDAVEFDLSKFDVTTLTGVEWYPDSDMMPIQFSHTGNRCGALVLWTRER